MLCDIEYNTQDNRITRREFLGLLGCAAIGSYLTGCTSTSGSNSIGGPAVPAALANSPERVDLLDFTLNNQYIKVGIAEPENNPDNNKNTTKYRCTLFRKSGNNWQYVTQKDVDPSATNVNNIIYAATAEFNAADGVTNGTLYKITAAALNRDNYPSNNPPSLEDITAYHKLMKETYTADADRMLHLNV